MKRSIKLVLAAASLLTLSACVGTVETGSEGDDGEAIRPSSSESTCAAAAALSKCAGALATTSKCADARVIAKCQGVRP